MGHTPYSLWQTSHVIAGVWSENPLRHVPVSRVFAPLITVLSYSSLKILEKLDLIAMKEETNLYENSKLTGQGES